MHSKREFIASSSPEGCCLSFIFSYVFLTFHSSLLELALSVTSCIGRWSARPRTLDFTVFVLSDADRSGPTSPWRKQLIEHLARRTCDGSGVPVWLFVVCMVVGLFCDATTTLFTPLIIGILAHIPLFDTTERN